MISLNCKLILKNKKFIMSFILIMLLSIFIFLYEEKNQKYEGVQYSNCIKDLCTGEITEEQLYDTSYTENDYYEYLLKEKVSEYLWVTNNYEEVRNQIINNEKAILHSKSSTVVQKVRSKLMLQKYEELGDVDVQVGNYTAYEHFFKLDLYDYFPIIIIFICIYFLVLYEKERNISKLIASTPKGGRSYYIKKVVAIFIVGIIVTIVSMGIKLLICISMFGTDDLSVSIQSINGFVRAPYNISIIAYLFLFFGYRVLLMLMFIVVTTAICSFSLKNSAISVVLVIGIGTLLLLNTMITSSSGLVMLRDISFFRLFDLNYYIQGYRVYCLIMLGSSAIMESGFTLPFVAICSVMLLFTFVGMQCHYRGIKNAGRGRSYSLLLKYKSGIFCNELKNILIRQNALIIMIAIIGGCVLFMYDFQENKNTNIVYEREMVKTLNKLPYDSARELISEKYAEMQGYQEQLAEAGQMLAEGKISKNVYENLYTILSMQLSYYYIVEDLYYQSIDIDEYNLSHKNNIKYEYKSFSEEVVGARGNDSRIMLGFFMSVFLITICSTVFPKEKERQAEKLIQSTRYGDKSFLCKGIICTICSMSLSVILYGLWIYSLICRYKFVGYNNSIQSMQVYRLIPIKLNCAEVIIAEVFLQCLKWGVITLFVIVASMQFKSVFTSEIMSIVLLAFPLGFELMGVSVKNIIVYCRYMIFGETIISNSFGIIVLILLLVVFTLLCRKGISKWKMS